MILLGYGLRFCAALFAVILGVQAVWVLTAELVRADLPFFPSSDSDIEIFARYRTATAMAAWIGWPRGDLMVDHALSEDAAALAAIENATTAEALNEAKKTRDVAEQAAVLAPYDSRAWLALAASNVLSRPDEGEALSQIKMSYYTSPNDTRLMPFRIQVAMRLPKIDDDELMNFIRHEFEAIVRHTDGGKNAIANAYRGGSMSGRSFIERTLATLDPALLKEIRGNPR